MNENENEIYFIRKLILKIHNIVYKKDDYSSEVF
jgi:hypothetical protein